MIQPQGASVRNISIKGSLKELNGRFPYSFTYPNLWNPYPFVYLSMPIVLVPLLSVFFLQVVLVTLDVVVHFLDFVLFLDVALFFIVFFFSCFGPLYGLNRFLLAVYLLLFVLVLANVLVLLFLLVLFAEFFLLLSVLFFLLTIVVFLVIRHSQS